MIPEVEGGSRVSKKNELPFPKNNKPKKQTNEKTKICDSLTLILNKNVLTEDIKLIKLIKLEFSFFMNTL